MSRVVPSAHGDSGHLRRTYLRACPDCPELSRLKTNRVDAEMNPPRRSVTHGCETVQLLEHDLIKVALCKTLGYDFIGRSGGAASGLTK